jgi:lipopolysaccharide/colanic/teichoic acid biosynthesis glycosyltransferase
VRPAITLIVKRLFDLVFSFLGIVALLPVFAVVAVAVAVSSEGPVLFRQERIGRNGVPFHILKFRSMRVANEGRQITVAGDRRITPVGGVLRRTKLDELPQLFNVLLGDMSFVGPRPEVRRYVELYPSDLRSIILSVRPGITDNAAIEFRNESDLLGKAADPEAEYVNEIMPRKLALYREYVEKQSFLGDLWILLRTLAAITGQ